MAQNFTYTDYSNTDPFHSVCIWNNIFEILFRHLQKCRFDIF